MKKTKVIAIILAINLICVILLNMYPSKIYAASQRVENQIDKIDESKYPGIKSMIEKLQKEHTNWKFKFLYTGLDWNTVINEESKHGRNLIGANQKNYSGDWLCKECEDNKKTYSGGKWVCVSNEAVAYMMDPRNSLYYEDVFQFLELSYDQNVTYNREIIQNILKGTFLDDGNLETYITTIIDRCKEKNANPYYIAGKIIQEQGKKGGATFKMQYTEEDKITYYYNIFNINATGDTTDAIVKNALSWARKKEWDTIEKCLIGGIDFISNGYISIGQDTMYFEKFDVIADNYYTHQYAQDVMYAQNQGEKLRNILEKINATEYEYTFVIPLYENMPSVACKRPAITRTETTNNTTNNNFSENNNNNTNNNAEDNNNNNTGNSTEKTIDQNKNTVTEQETNTEIGDVNEDGKISSSDYVLIKNHIMGTKTLSEKAKKYADYNKDGKVSSSDYVLIKNYIMSK